MENNHNLAQAQKVKMTFANGDVYDGEWKDSKRHGKGKMTSAVGDVYDGKWKDNKKYGKGKKRSTEEEA